MSMLRPLLLAALLVSQDCLAQSTTRAADSVDLDWFEGTWDEALAAARRSNRLLFVDVSRAGCAYCKKLDETTLRDPAVAKELRELLCFELAGDAPENAAVVRRYAPTIYPTLLFLERDGEVRDRILGFVDAEQLVEETRRIKRNDGTLSQLRARITADPRDVDARYALAVKLRRFGDEEGWNEQVARIREHDPEGKSLPSRRLELDRLRRGAEGTMDPAELYLFLERESESSVLFEGWFAVWQIEGYLERVTRKANQRKEHRELRFAAARALWLHVPRDGEHFVSLGTSIARSFYDARRYLTPEDLAWALGVAREVAGAAPADCSVQDTLACALFAAGKVNDAIARVKACIEREPGNPSWKERLREFTDRR